MERPQGRHGHPCHLDGIKIETSRRTLKSKMHPYNTRFQKARSELSNPSGSTAHIPIHRAVLPTGIYYYTDKDLKKAKKEMHRILDEIEASAAPSLLVTEFFEYVWDHPYILDAYKNFKDVVEKKVDAIISIVREHPAEKFQSLHRVLQKVKSIL